jgi:hypothetical protein
LSLESANTRGTPGYAKTVMLAQTFVILFLTFWLYEQYLNDFYFQAYLNGTLQSNGLLLVIVASIGIFVMIGTGFYLRLRGTRNRLSMIVSTGETMGQSSKSNTSITILEPHVEQQLIEMIRKSTTADSIGQSRPDRSRMPVLKHEDNTGSSSSSTQ